MPGGRAFPVRSLVAPHLRPKAPSFFGNPSLRSLGTVVATSTNTPSFAAPANPDPNDVILVAFFADDGRRTVTGVPTGFTPAPGLPQINNTGAGSPSHGLYVYWGRFSVVGAGPYSFTLAGTAGLVEGSTAAIQNCVTTGNPIEAATGATSGGTTVTTAPSVSATSLDVNRYAFYVATNWTGGAWTPATGYAEQWDANDRIITFDDLLMPYAASTTPQAVCAGLGDSNAWVGLFLPIPPSTPTPPPPTVPSTPSRDAARMFPRRVGRRPAASVVPAQVVTPPAPPVRPVRIPVRVLFSLHRPGRIGQPTPTQAIPAPPAYPPAAVRTRLRGLRVFRARAAAPLADQGVTSGVRRRPALSGIFRKRPTVVGPVAPQLVVPPAYPIQPVRIRPRGVRLFRGRSAGPALDQGAVPLGGVRPPIKRGGAKGRPRACAPPIDQPSTPGQQRPRLRLPRPSRGRTAQPVPPQLAVTPPAYPPAAVRTRLRGLRLFRGRAAVAIPAQAVVTAPGIVIQAVRVRLRGLRVFRGRAASPVPAQTVVPPGMVLQAVRVRVRALWPRRSRQAAALIEQANPPAAPHSRPRGVTPRHGRVAGPPIPQIAPPAAYPPGQEATRRGRATRPRPARSTSPVPAQTTVVPPAYPPRPVRSRLKGLRSARGREAATPVPAQVVIVAPKFPPLFSRLKQHAARIFRGKSRTPVVPVCDCETHRPNLGVTARPSSGVTGRPGSGTTGRPDAGMTLRPDSGITDRPCTCQN